MRALWLLCFLGFGTGCSCDPFVESRFVCAVQADCAEGFECRDVGAGLECVRSGTAADAGSDAGQLDAGEQDAGTLDAGDQDAGDQDAGADGGDQDAGADAGVGMEAVALRFATPAQTVLAGACTSVLVVETVNAGGGATPVSAATSVTLSSAPSGVSFFTSSTCTTAAVTSVTIAANASSATFYASGSPARTFALVANAPPLTGANQLLVVADPPTSLAFTSTPPNPVRGGTCLPATVEARRGGVPNPVLSTTSIGLTVAPSGGARFFTDANCTASTSTATMLGGATTAAFFVKPLSGGTSTLSAAAPFGTALQALTVTPIVRRGTCTFPAPVALSDGGTSTSTTLNCPVAPALTDLSASFSMIQTTAALGSSELGAAEVRCRLSSPTNLACSRRQGADSAQVHFQVAEVPQGMLVQRTTSTSCPSTITLGTAVNPSRAFLLKETASSTTTFDDEDVAVAQLTSSTTVSLSPATCSGVDLQVVDWAGLTVTRGTLDGGMPLGSASLTVSGLPAASPERALLLQPGTTLNGTRPICSTLVRGAMPSASSLVLTRGAGSSSCTLTPLENVHYERVDFGGKAVVREYSASFGGGESSVPVTITPVDASRTLVFSSSQSAGGQGAGESAHGGSATFTEGLFALVLTSANTVTVGRGDSADPAQVTFYVAELVP